MSHLIAIMMHPHAPTGVGSLLYKSSVRNRGAEDRTTFGGTSSLVIFLPLDRKMAWLATSLGSRPSGSIAQSGRRSKKASVNSTETHAGSTVLETGHTCLPPGRHLSPLSRALAQQAHQKKLY